MSTLVDIYHQVFGTSSIANNEIPTWMVHGYIAQCKGIPINWTKAAKSTTKEKTCRGEMSKGQTTTKKERSSDSCDAMNPNAEGL